VTNKFNSEFKIELNGDSRNRSSNISRPDSKGRPSSRGKLKDEKENPQPHPINLIVRPKAKEDIIETETLFTN